MGLDQVKEEIIAQATLEAKRLVATAKEQAKKDMQLAKDEAATFKEALGAELEKELEVLDNRYNANMKMVGRKILFQKRKDLLDSTFADVREAVAKMPKGERGKMLSHLFQKAKKQCNVGRVYCAKQDATLVKKLCRQVQTMDIVGGIIVESKDRTIRVDYSFDSLLQDLEEKKLQEVAALLFPA